MDNFENEIEKYQKELLNFMKSNPAVKTESKETNTEECKPENTIPANVNIQNEESVDTVNENLQKSVADIAENDSDNKVPAVPEFSDYESFLASNSQKGSLQVQVFAANRSFPVVNARVTVLLMLKNGAREMFDGLTDINGIVDNIILPAPEKSMSQQPSATAALPYSSYTTLIEHPEYVNAKYVNVPVFSGIKSIQGVEMIPLIGTDSETPQREYNENQSFERIRGGK